MDFNCNCLNLRVFKHIYFRVRAQAMMDTINNVYLTSTTLNN